MFYEEKIVDGILYCRTSPNGEWQPATDRRAQLVNELAQMDDERRLSIMGLFCSECGDIKPKHGCTCMRDE